MRDSTTAELTGGAEVTPAQLRKALGTFVSGVTVVTTSTQDGDVHGMTANAFTSVSMDPPLVLVSVATSARMDHLIRTAGHYGVSILGGRQEPLSLHFAGAPSKERVAEPSFCWRDGVPFVDGALVHLACDVYDSHVAGDHRLHIGRVKGLWHQHGDPLVYFTGCFHRLDAQGVVSWSM